MDIYDFIRLYHYAKQDAWAVIDGVRDAVLASGRADLLPALDRAQARILEAADVEADVAQAERAQQAKVGTRLAARSL
ncbi:MAG TPA: hypothetical protein PKA64_24005, partial [Myxococcota bacterium]|nr:hypothetical protein [Myxococcota bacterium]